MKGMQKIKRGTNARGKLEYSFDNKKGDKGVIVGGNMTGTTPCELTKEFSASRKLRKDIEKPVWHNSLRLPAGETLPPETWDKIGNEYMKRMGFSDLHQRVFIMHDDPNGQHIHIDACRIALDGTLYLGKNENLKSTQIIHQLEIEFGLSVHSVKQSPGKTQRKPPGHGEKGLAERIGAAPTKMQLQAIIDEAVKDKPQFSEFLSRLNLAGVSVLPSGKTGAPQGVSFEFNGIAFKGSDLGKSYAWKALQGRIEFDRDRDQGFIDELRERALSESNEIKPNASFAPISNCSVRTLELVFQKNGSAWEWKGKGRAAFIDHGDHISINSKSDIAIKAALQLSRQKWGNDINITGSESYRQKAWLIGSQMNLNISGYEPMEADKEILKQLILEAEARRNEQRKSSAVAEPGRSPGSTENDSVRASRFGAENGDRPQLDSGRGKDGDHGSLGSESRAREDAVVSGAIPATATDNLRSADLADAASVDIDRRGFGDMRDAAVQISDLAAPLLKNRSIESAIGKIGKERPDTVQPVLTKEHAAKIAAWEKQSEALGAEKYRITLKSRAEKDSNGRKLFEQNYGNVGNKSNREAAGVCEKFWTKDEIKTEIAKLRAKNAQGYDVYITPIDDRYHFLVVDDMTVDNYSDMLKVGIKPAIVQKSSANNKQAIIIIDRENSKDEQKLANQVVTYLNKKWGDPKFSGVIHPFRMAGFSNKKAGKNNYLTTLEVSIHQKCSISSVAMQKIRNEDELKKQEADRLKNALSIKQETDKEYNRRLSKIDEVGQRIDNAVELAYRREVKKTLGVAKKQGWTLDWSRVDYAATKELLKAGYKPDLIEKAIVDSSPGLADRHRDAIRYSGDTVRNAGTDKGVLKYIAEQAQRAEQDRGRGISR